jgi:hypothetical protein
VNLAVAAFGVGFSRKAVELCLFEAGEFFRKL